MLALPAETVLEVAITIGRSENYNSPIYPFIDLIRDDQVTVAESTYRCAWYSTNNRVLSSGEELFEYGSDGHHFSGLGQMDLGRAMGRTLLDLGLFVPAR